MTSIRRFRNPDLPGLVRLWNEHFGIAASAHSVSAAVFEQAVLSRTFFDPQQLRVADAGSGPVGFAHWMVPANQQNGLQPRCAPAAVVAAVCVPPGPQAAQIADQLLADCERAAAAEGHDTLYVGGAPGELNGYAGLHPLGPGEGIADDDLSTAGWLTSRGFAPHRRIGRYRIEMASFRPPVDRPLMMLRRTTQVRSQVVQPADWRSASALAHVQIERFLSTHRNGATIASADFWLSDPEALVLAGGTAILDQWRSDDAADQHAAARLLIASALQELADRGIACVEAVAATDQWERAELLRALRFQQHSQGTVFAKEL